ncbi:hypothetical protein DFQ29_003329, partial [Apophysomyces sp. BC1021]
MHIEKKVHRADYIALNGGYMLFVDKKQKNVELTPNEIEYNKTFSSFHSHIEAAF